MARPRIKTLEISDFRAFPGPTVEKIELDGKNLLVYGENGSGKSTLYQALYHMFAVNWSPSDLTAELVWQSNRFTAPEHKGQSKVAVTYDDGKPPAIWSSAGHPANTEPGPADERIVNAAWANAILDYRSLLETNYDHGVDEVNLFHVCVNYLLRDYVTVGGDRLGEIWNRLDSKLKLKQIRKAQLDEINRDSRAFNDGLAEATAAILPLINPLLEKLKRDEVRVTALTPSRIAYNNATGKEAREYDGCKIIPQITFSGIEIDYPQLFLNEARLSALALAIYFAGRKLAENQTKNDMPRIMVLDDVIIGLDQSNRLPILEVLGDEFSDWQIILLTHDRVWFEMAKAHLPDKGAQAWTALEMFEGIEPNGITRPILRPKNMDVITDNLNLATAFLADHHDNAAAVHTRMAFEQVLKKFCERKGVPVAFKSNPKDLNTENLLNAIDAWLGSDARRAPQKAVLDPHLSNAKACRSVILNPYSHSTPVTLVAAEIQTAIDAVRTLNSELNKAFPKNANP
jgi:hypothetical protein